MIAKSACRGEGSFSSSDLLQFRASAGPFCNFQFKASSGFIMSSNKRFIVPDERKDGQTRNLEFSMTLEEIYEDVKLEKS
jgi:hypothetical protein